MILRKIIRMIQAMVRGLWLTLSGSRPVLDPSIEQKQPDPGGSSTKGETTATATNLSDNVFQGESSEGSSDSQETVLGESRDENLYATDGRDGALREAPTEQPSLAGGESFESGKVKREDITESDPKESGFPTSDYRGSDETPVSSPEDASWIFRSPLEPSVKPEQLDTGESSTAGEAAAATDDAEGNAPWWKSSGNSTDLQETVSGGSRNGNLHAADDQDGALGEDVVEQPDLNSGEAFESGKVAGGDKEDPDSGESEFPASYYRGSDATPLDSPEDEPPKPDPPSEQTAEDDLGARSSNAGGGGLPQPSSDELPSPPEKPKPGGPREIESRRIFRGDSTQRREPEPKRPAQQRSPVSYPEWICRKTLGSTWQWEVFLSADEECRVVEARQDGRSLDIVNGECRPGSYAGSLCVVSEGDEQSELPMFDGAPLIFKLRKDWSGDGRKVGGITKGYFIIIVPGDWKRTGHALVEQQGCADPNFAAHYFFRNGDEPIEDVGGFEGYELSSSNSFELSGERVFDDSEEGELFVGTTPKLTVNSGVARVRVGEERKGGWKGENFKPSGQSLSDLLESREGRFFVRVFNAELKRLESGEFRYLRDLREILVNGERYTDSTLLLPSSTGHSPAEIRFVGVNGASITPSLPADATHMDVRQGNLIIAPHPDADRVSCTLESGSGRVGIVLELPRVWWRLERDGSEPGEWRDTLLLMTRQEFRDEAYSNATIRLRLPRRIRSVVVGFDENQDQAYRSQRKEGNVTETPLPDFVDHSQIDRRLNEDAFLNVQCGGAVLPLIRVSADPVPTIISFTCVPMAVNAGEKATLRWKTRNAETDGVAIDPGIGAVELGDALEIAPRKTTTYTLRLTASGMDDVTESVTVNFLPRPDEKPVALVKHNGGGCRRGKGFSLGELRASGLTVSDVSPRSMPIDKRWRSTHQANIVTIGRLINA